MAAQKIPNPGQSFSMTMSWDCPFLFFGGDANGKLTYRISANSFRGNYSFLNLALFTVTFDLYFINLNSCRGNYSREETIQGRKLFAEIRYISCCSRLLIKLLADFQPFPNRDNFFIWIRNRYVMHSLKKQLTYQKRVI